MVDEVFDKFFYSFVKNEYIYHKNKEIKYSGKCVIFGYNVCNVYSIQTPLMKNSQNKIDKRFIP